MFVTVRQAFVRRGTGVEKTWAAPGLSSDVNRRPSLRMNLRPHAGLDSLDPKTLKGFRCKFALQAQVVAEIVSGA